MKQLKLKIRKVCKEMKISKQTQELIINEIIELQLSRMKPFHNYSEQTLKEYIEAHYLKVV